MSNSNLVSVKVMADSSNYTKGRSGNKIEMITIHHMAGVLTAKQCGAIFQKKGRKGSAHYGVGKNGEIGLYVDESNTSWANSNWTSNCKSVTIETSNSSTGGQWLVSDKTLNSLIKLVADIAKRNGLGKLVKGKNLTWHSMYTNTTCPGNYLRSKIDYIIEQANLINYPVVVETKYTIIAKSGLNIRAKASTLSSRLGAIPYNKTVKVTKTSGSWGYTTYNKINGWICLKYAKKN